MIDKTNLLEALSLNAERIVERARFYLNVRKKNTKGKNLYKSLRSNVRVLPRSIEISFEGKDYAGVVDKGRRAGYYVPVDAIRKWIDAKPIKLRSASGAFIKRTSTAKDEAAKRIAWKIYHEGIKGSNFFSDAVKDRINELDESVLNAYKLDAENYFDDFFLKAKNRAIKGK